MKRHSVRQDPYWTRAKYAGTDRNGTPFVVGDQIFIYPACRGERSTIYAGEAAKTASAEFDAACFDEAEYNGGGW
uniref:Uncharacterized protein n=1 Tax=viral metagenome TaxID=1070528 RepID=A0A6M3IYK2_9ZZZZ